MPAAAGGGGFTYTQQPCSNSVCRERRTMGTLYVDMMSQPSRACVVFVKMNNIPVEIKQVHLHKGDSRSTEYLAINPLGKVPFLCDGDLALPESAAIMLYLAAKHKLPQHWYPHTTPGTSEGLKQRARADAALHWQHSTLRAGSMKYCWHTAIARNMGQAGNPVIAKDGEVMLKMALQAMEHYWLARSPYMAGDDVGIADLMCACELEQTTIVAGAEGQHPALEELLVPYPKVAEWLQRVRARCEPCYEGAHSVLRRVVQRMVQRKAEAAAAKARL